MSPIELQHTLDIRTLTTVLIHHFGLHEGTYQLNVGFRIGVGGFNLDSGVGTTPLPGAVVGVEGVSLTRIPQGVEAPNSVDAAQVNPLPVVTPKTKARVRQAK